jgi:TonB family protein
MDRECSAVTTEQAKRGEKFGWAMLCLALSSLGLVILDEWSLLAAHLNPTSWVALALMHPVVLLGLFNVYTGTPKGTRARLNVLSATAYVIFSWSMDLSLITGKVGANSLQGVKGLPSSAAQTLPASAMRSGQPTVPQVLRIGERVAASLLQESSKPIYPLRAKTEGVHGMVNLQVRIGSDGHVADVKLVSGHPLLAPAAIDAVKGYVYKPFMLNGAAVDVLTTVEVEFGTDGVVHSPQAARNDDIQVSVAECRTIQMTLNARLRERGNVPAADDFTAAGHACDRLGKAISTADQVRIPLEAAALRAILARLGRPPSSPREQIVALEETISGSSEMELFYKLPDLAKRAFNAGEADKAKAYSKQLLEMAPQHPKDWNYGNAIYFGNLVLGRIAVREDNLALAGQYLLAAGATPGSPQLDSFGPNVSLARELIEKGQSDVVLQYFALCKRFWKMDHGKLDEWSATVRRGGIPDFNGNLYY